MQNEHFYDVAVSWDSDRKGTLSSTVLSSTISVATPPEFPKGMPDIWSPEHLLVAAINSCLMTTFLAVAENSKLHFETFKSEAAGKLEIVDGKYMISEVTLKPVVSITEAEDREKAERVLRKSESACLITNSVRSKVMMIPEVRILQPA